jgi:hypothetical protein
VTDHPERPLRKIERIVFSRALAVCSAKNQQVHPLPQTSGHARSAVEEWLRELETGGMGRPSSRQSRPMPLRRRA